MFEVSKNTESKNTKVGRTQNRKIMLLSKCRVFDSKESKFVKQQEASQLLLRRLVIKTPVSKVTLVGLLLVH